MYRSDSAAGRMLTQLSLIRESAIGTFGILLVMFWVTVALFAPLILPFDPNANYVEALIDPTPSATHWLGVDMQGRDILSRIIWGSRTVLSIAPLAVLTAYVVGCFFGLLAGYYRGIVDTVVNFVANSILSFPAIVLYIIVIMRFGASAINIILAVFLVASPQIMRIVRGLTLEIREREYVAAAKMRGESTLYILLVEILPNIRGPLIVDACLRIGYSTIAIGVLGFLGLGLPPPTPDWGGMVKDSYALLSVYPHMSLFPAAAITSVVVGFSLIADGIREVGMRD